jgi:hypothetical protein
MTHRHLYGDKNVFAIEFVFSSRFVWSLWSRGALDAEGPIDADGLCFYWIAGVRFGDESDGPNPLLSWIKILRYLATLPEIYNAAEFQGSDAAHALRALYTSVYDSVMDDPSPTDQLGYINRSRALLAPDGSRPFDVGIAGAINSPPRVRLIGVQEEHIAHLLDGTIDAAQVASAVISTDMFHNIAREAADELFMLYCT